MATSTNTDQNDQLFPEMNIKEEHKEFNSNAEEKESFYKATDNILHRSKKNEVELLSMEEGSQNMLNAIKREEGECYYETIHNVYTTDVSENTAESCIKVVKEEFRSDKGEEMYESERNKNFAIKYDIKDDLHSVLQIKNEELIIKDEDKLDSEYSSSEDEGEPCSSTKVISRSESDEDNKIHNIERPFKCVKCKKSFSRKEHLIEHTFIHAGEKLYKCNKCEKSFISRNNLRSHALIHAEQPHFKCDQCYKIFSRKQHLVEHTFTHTGERPFKCDKCERRFIRRNELKDHALVHAGETPFKCDKCKKTFSRKLYLIQHSFIHTGERPYKCDKCEKSYIRRNHLNNHALTRHGEAPLKFETSKKEEQPFKCDRRALLKQHAIIRVEGKPFKCDVCEKHFSRREYLTQHSLVHTGEKPFKCDKCDQTFKWRASLNRHNKRVHNVGLK